LTNIALDSREKLVIIPDVHNDYQAAESIISKEKPDRTVFLGDYFDDFHDTLADAGSTAKWLAGSLEQGNRTHLIGNHDIGYMTDNPELKCTGYRQDKHEVIRKHGIAWNKLLPFCWINGGDWLCTHAGLTKEFYEQQASGKNSAAQQVLELAANDLQGIDDAGRPHAFFEAGFLRGGANPVGGITWCDYDEFVDIPGIKQIFGHTRGDTVRHRKTNDSEHYCIDTGLGHYAVYKNSMMRIRSV